MRRWLLWGGGSLIAVAGVLAGLALIFGRSGNSFDFLEGRKPVTLHPGSQRLLDSTDMYVAYYTFEADFAGVLALARAELVSQGFREYPKRNPRHNLVRFEIGDASQAGSPNREGGVTNVQVYQDMRYGELGRRSTTEKGWVTVRVLDLPPKGLFDRFRRWLGL